MHSTGLSKNKSLCNKLCHTAHILSSGPEDSFLQPEDATQPQASALGPLESLPVPDNIRMTKALPSSQHRLGLIEYLECKI